MPLYLIPTPIGPNAKDFSQRSVEILDRCSHIIVEDLKQGSKHLKQVGLENKELWTLNEHTTREEIEKLITLCLEHPVALMSDAGTPNFCDPGHQLIAGLRKKRGKITSVPGPSSLMTLLSLSSRRIDQFFFRGFLPQDSALRTKAWEALTRFSCPIVILDTPYRLTKTAEELACWFKGRSCLIGANLSHSDEWVWEGPCEELVKHLPFKKAEFLVLIYEANRPR